MNRLAAVSAAVAASLAASGCIAAIETHDAAAAPPMKPHKQAVVPDGWQSVVDDFQYSPALISGDLIFVSGVPGGVRDGEITDEKLEQAYRRIFSTIGGLLDDAGASWGDVVEIVSYHTDMPAHIDAFVKVKAEFTTSAPYPAWTAVDVDRLYPNSALVEVKVIARKPQHDG